MDVNRAAGTWVFAALLLCLLPAVAPAQGDSSMEEFEAVDPYTQGDPELVKSLGYVSLGPFPWLKGETTTEAVEKMGAIPMLWVETAHFRIGSTLTTYKFGSDRIEKERLQTEFDRLREKLGKLKAPRREIDPWLRLHLYAQRMEDVYAAFLADFDLEEADFAELGPYLGQTEKFRLLVCERKSEYARHASHYLDHASETSHRFGWSAMGMGFATNDEMLRNLYQSRAGVPLDTVLFSTIASGTAQVLLDAYRRNDYGSPEWLRRGYSHYASRRFDERYVSDAGYEEGQNIGDDDWIWEPRVANLVKNEFFVKTSEMFGWASGQALNKRDHMVAWSRTAYLLEEAEGDRAAFLAAVCQPQQKGEPDVVKNAMIARQNRALKDAFQLLPDELDAAWATWVKKTYTKK